MVIQKTPPGGKFGVGTSPVLSQGSGSGNGVAAAPSTTVALSGTTGTAKSGYVPPSGGGPTSGPPTLRDKTPIYAMAFMNCALSYWGAVGVQGVAEVVFPMLAELPVLNTMFTTERSTQFDLPGIWDRFVDTMIFGMACTPFYGGLSAFNFLPTGGQQQAVRRRFPRVTEKAVSWWQGLRKKTSEKFAAKFAETSPRFHQYFGRFVDKGVVGIVGMLKERDSAKIGWLQRSQEWLSSKPLTRLAQRLGERVGQLGLRKVQATEATAAIDAAVDRAAAVTEFGARLVAGPESLLTFLGGVLPTEKAKFTGLGTELTVSTGIGGIEAILFGSTWSVGTFAQSAVINSTTGFANVAVSQHKEFDQQAVWWERTKIGILKGSVYRGICTTKTVTGWFGYAVQAAYGLAAMAYANRITGGATSSAEDMEAAIAQRREAIEANLRVYLENSSA